METTESTLLSPDDLRTEIADLTGEHYTLTMRMKWVDIRLRSLREQLHQLNTQGE